MRIILAVLLIAASCTAQTAVVGNEPDFSFVCSPAQLTGNVNNYGPTGCLEQTATIRLTSDASRNITGLANGWGGRVVIIQNVGAQDIVLVDASGSSSAANRFELGGNVTLAAEQGVTLRYDGASLVWRPTGGAGSGVAGSSAFADLTAGTNTTAAMVVGTGASLTVSGSGTINATTLGSATFAAPGAIGGGTPSTGAFTTISATGAVTAASFATSAATAGQIALSEPVATGTDAAGWKAPASVTTPYLSEMPAAPSAGVLQWDASAVMTSTAPGTSGNLLESNGTAFASVAPKFSRPCAPQFATEELNNSSITTEQTFAVNCQIPANALIAGVAYEVCVGGELTSSNSPTFIFKFKAGTTVLYSTAATTPPAITAGGWGSCFTVMGSAAAGAAASVYTTCNNCSSVSTTTSFMPATGANKTAQPIALATNGALTLQFSIQFSSTTGTNNMKLYNLTVKKLT